MALWYRHCVCRSLQRSRGYKYPHSYPRVLVSYFTHPHPPHPPPSTKPHPSNPTMFSTLLLTLTLAASALAGPCHENNCQRAVQRTWQGQAVYDQHMVDCVKNLACVSTPPAYTSTQTVTATAGTITISIPRVTVAPTQAGTPGGLTCGTGNIPADQAANCENNFASYTSACLCAGKTGTTSVGPTQTVVATVSVTEPAKIVYV